MRFVRFVRSLALTGLAVSCDGKTVEAVPTTADSAGTADGSVAVDAPADTALAVDAPADTALAVDAPADTADLVADAPEADTTWVVDSGMGGALDSATTDSSFDAEAGATSTTLCTHSYADAAPCPPGGYCNEATIIPPRVVCGPTSSDPDAFVACGDIRCPANAHFECQTDGGLRCVDIYSPPAGPLLPPDLPIG